MARARTKKRDTAAERPTSLPKLEFSGPDANSVLEHLPIGVFMIDVGEDGTFSCASINEVFGSLLNIDLPAFVRSLLAGGESSPDLAPFVDRLRHCVATRCPEIFEWTRRAGPDSAHLECHIVPIAAEGEPVRRMVGTLADRTPQRRAERRMLHHAFHDDLTDLPNRARFMESLESVCLGSGAAPARVHGLLLLNVDRIQIVNESLGYIAGDELLISVARRLRKCARPEDLLARIGGDEFALLVDNIEGPEEARTIADMIHRRMGIAFNLSGAEVFVSLGIGIATGTGGDSDPDILVSDASLALNRAKSAGKAKTEIYTEAIKQRPKSLLQLETDLRRAVAREEFELHYQPLVTLGDLRLAGFEALSRWRHPDRGLVSPCEFIPLAEETGLIVPLGKWVLREACRQHKEWLERHPDLADLFMSINVSGIQFGNERLVDDIREILADTGLDGSRLKLEITESVIMENAELAAAVLRELKTLGIAFAVDDFGTGYSSLSYLNRFPIDILKIDRCFVSAMHQSEESFKIVRILASLAATLDLKLVAEGIETTKQLEDLRDLGCHMGQGYLFARPLPAADAERLLGDSQCFSPARE